MTWLRAQYNKHTCMMKRLWPFGVATAFFLALVACQEREPVASPPAAAAPAQHQSPTKAQAKLPTIKLWLGPAEITAEIASTPIQVETGMMHRSEMAENEGMIFVFGRPHRASFWMRNTKIPLSCAYIDPDGKILETHDMKPLDETGIEASSDNVQYVLETKQGWFERNKVPVGAIVRTDRGSL